VSCTVDPPGLAIFRSNLTSDNPSGTVPVALTVEDLVVGDDPATQDLTIRNGADVGDQNLDLVGSGCAWTSGPSAGLSASAIAPTSLAAGGVATASTTFTCNADEPGDKSGIYSCEYDREGGLPEKGGDSTVVNFDVSCGVRAPRSEVFADPQSGDPLPTINVPVGQSGTTSVELFEDYGDEEGAVIHSCFMDDGSDFSVVSPSFSYDLDGDSSVDIVVEGSLPGGVNEASDTLICQYTDTECEPELSKSVYCEFSWPVEIRQQELAPVPTMSTWSRMLMILGLFAMGGVLLRRRNLIG
jgi:hypothetical protein